MYTIIVINIILLKVSRHIVSSVKTIVSDESMLHVFKVSLGNN